jgi:hypothetical protein
MGSKKVGPRSAQDQAGTNTSSVQAEPKLRSSLLKTKLLPWKAGQNPGAASKLLPMLHFLSLRPQHGIPTADSAVESIGMLRYVHRDKSVPTLSS